MSKSGKLKRYNSGINNIHGRLNDKKSGKDARKKYYELTGNKIFLEKNFIKNLEKGKSISKIETKRAFAEIRDKKVKILKEDYLDLKKDRDNRLKDLRKQLKRARTRKHKDQDKIDRLKREIEFQKKSLDKQRDFIENNLHDDIEFQDIRELFNSP